MVYEPLKLFFGKRQVVELVLEYNPRVVESVLDDIVACRNLLGRKRNLRHVVLPLVRVVLCAVGNGRNRVGSRLGLRYRVELRLGVLLFAVVGSRSHHRLVHPLPVVHILALAP